MSFIGDGSEKWNFIQKREYKFTPIIYPSAKVMAKFVEQAFIAQKFGYRMHRPYYLKTLLTVKKQELNLLTNLIE